MVEYVQDNGNGKRMPAMWVTIKSSIGHGVSKEDIRDAIKSISAEVPTEEVTGVGPVFGQTQGVTQGSPEMDIVVAPSGFSIHTRLSEDLPYSWVQKIVRGFMDNTDRATHGIDEAIVWVGSSILPGGKIDRGITIQGALSGPLMEQEIETLESLGIDEVGEELFIVDFTDAEITTKRLTEIIGTIEDNTGRTVTGMFISPQGTGI